MLKFESMEDVVIPYELPETENHSFFFIDQRIDTRLEAKLHKHDAWELYCVLQGEGTRMAGDTLLPFKEGDVALIESGFVHIQTHNIFLMEFRQIDQGGRIVGNHFIFI